MHQSIMTIMKKFASEDWAVETNLKHSIIVFEC